jgi:hypothetical protein
MKVDGALNETIIIALKFWLYVLIPIFIQFGLFPGAC